MLPATTSVTQNATNAVSTHASKDMEGALAHLCEPMDEQGEPMDNHEHLHRETVKFECANLLLHVLMISQHFPRGDEPTLTRKIRELRPLFQTNCRQVAAQFNDLVSDIAINPSCDDSNEDAGEVVFNALLVSYVVLEDAMLNPFDGAQLEGDRRLQICMIDMLRMCSDLGTAGGCFWDKTENVEDLAAESADLREYSKCSRSDEAQMESDMCNFMRSHRNQADRKAYATADAMFYNFRKGLANLEELLKMTREQRVYFLNNAKQPLFNFLNSYVVPMIFDGKRMAWGNCSAEMHFAPPPRAGDEFAFGSGSLVGSMFNSPSNMISLSRVVYTISAIVAMAQQKLWLAAEATVDSSGFNHYAAEPDEAAQAHERQQRILACLSQSTQWSDIQDLLAEIRTSVKEMTSGKRTSQAPAGNKVAIDRFASWFEECVRNKSKFDILHHAFTYEGLCMDKPSAEVCNHYYEFVEANSCDEAATHEPFVNVWTASTFLVYSRLRAAELRTCGSNILMNVLVVFSGAISRLTNDPADPNKVRGVFRFAPHLEQLIHSIYNGFELPAFSRQQKAGHAHGRQCASNKTTDQIFDKGAVRSQHEKTALVDTRLSACMFMLSLQESLLGDIHSNSKEGISAAPTEGRKPLRRLYIIMLMVLPGAQFTNGRRSRENVSYLIEKSQSNPNDNKTTDDNVEKPWRDVLGGALISTIFFPIAGRSFVHALEHLAWNFPRDMDVAEAGDSEEVLANKAAKLLSSKDDAYAFKCKTNQATQIFFECFLKQMQRTFELSATDLGQNNMVGCAHARCVMLQQHALALGFADCANNCGPLYECMKLTFGMVAKRETA